MCRVIVFDNVGRFHIEAAKEIGKDLFRLSDYEDHLELDGRMKNGKVSDCLCNSLTDEEIETLKQMAEAMFGEDYYVQRGYDNVINSSDIFVFRGARPPEAAENIQEARDTIQDLLHRGAEDMNNINLAQLQGWLGRLGQLIKKHPDTFK